MEKVLITARGPDEQPRAVEVTEDGHLIVVDMGELSKNAVGDEGPLSVTAVATGLTVPGNAEMCFVQAERTSGWMKYVFYGGPPTATRGYDLGPGDGLWLYGNLMASFNVVRQAAVDGELFITYFAV